VIDRHQRSSDHWIQWAILVLELAGVLAIFVPFAWGESPIEAWRLMSSQAVYSFTSWQSWYISVLLLLTALLSFHLAPLVSLAQLSRCLGRASTRWERRVCAAVSLLAIAGCLALLVLCVKEGVIERGSYFMGSGVAVFVAFGIVVGALVLWRRVSRRQKKDSAECLLLGAYIGGVAAWAAAFAYNLEPTAVVAGFTCVVYAVSLWRRMRA
jgi:hypothetical protein